MVSLSNKCWIRRIATLAIILIAGWMLLAYNYQPHLRPHRFKDEQYYRSSWPRDEFIETSIRTALEDDFDYSHIRAVCDASPWDESVVFRCENIEGGIGKL